jgi:phenylpropionate dioxygenase-like ring-hydroxylating dioxygenase large terminal subunit
LPAWAYIDEALLETEKDPLLRRHWEIAGYISNVPNPGDYFCFDVAGERTIIVRGKDDVVRVFHNVSCHRGLRVVADESGSCGSAFVCPFHGWSYNLEGTLRATPSPRGLPETHSRVWLYIGLFPNAVLYFYPDKMGFYQEAPMDVGHTQLRGGAYVLPDAMHDFAGDDRQLRCLEASRYLSSRIDNAMSEEDNQLTVWSNEASHSSGYWGFILSDHEYGVRQYHDQLRALMSILNHDNPPG